MGRIMHLNRIPQSHYVQRAPSPSPPQPFDLRSLAQGVIPSESVKKSGVRMSQADINLRPYPSSDGSCELFCAPYARWECAGKRPSKNIRVTRGKVSPQTRVPIRPTSQHLIPKSTIQQRQGVQFLKKCWECR